MNNTKTGKLIRQLRTEKKLTQKQLAELIGVSDKAVSKWETGKGYPDISLFSAIADVFGTDVRNLLMGNINKNEKENNTQNNNNIAPSVEKKKSQQNQAKVWNIH